MHTCFESLSITSEFPPQGREDGGSVSLYSPLDTQSLQKNNFVECRDLRSAGSPWEQNLPESIPCSNHTVRREGALAQYYSQVLPRESPRTEPSMSSCSDWESGVVSGVPGVVDLSGRVQSAEAHLQVSTGKRHRCWRWVPGFIRKEHLRDTTEDLSSTLVSS